MGYFGGLGSGRGWNKFDFILTPNEFQKVFDGLRYSFVTTNSRVESGYKESSKQNYFQAYKHFFERTLVGEELLNEQELWSIEEPILESIIYDIEKISFRDIKDEKGNYMPYKVAEPSEPVINISPFYLYFVKEKEFLSVAYCNPKGIIGLELSYPKYVTWYDRENPQTIETSSFESRTLFDTLVQRIKKCSSKAKVQSQTKLLKPNFWIGHEARSVINNNKYLVKNGLEII